MPVDERGTLLVSVFTLLYLRPLGDSGQDLSDAALRG